MFVFCTAFFSAVRPSFELIFGMDVGNTIRKKRFFGIFEIRFLKSFISKKLENLNKMRWGPWCSDHNSKCSRN